MVSSRNTFPEVQIKGMSQCDIIRVLTFPKQTVSDFNWFEFFFSIMGLDQTMQRANRQHLSNSKSRRKQDPIQSEFIDEKSWKRKQHEQRDGSTDFNKRNLDTNLTERNNDISLQRVQ